MKTKRLSSQYVSAFSIESWVSYLEAEAQQAAHNAVSAFSIESWVSYMVSMANGLARSSGFSILYRILGELRLRLWVIAVQRSFSILYRILGELRRTGPCQHRQLARFSILYRILGELRHHQLIYSCPLNGVSAFSIESWVSYHNVNFPD